jgi:hypothetical protein
MTNTEFAAWTKHTARSRNGWKLDSLTLANRGVTLMYHGGHDGRYIEVEGATVSVGSYEGAIPHIGEAIFTRQHTRTFANAQEAANAVMGAIGIKGLISILCER